MNSSPVNDMLAATSSCFILWDTSLEQRQKDMLIHYSCKGNIYALSLPLAETLLSSKIAVAYINACKPHG